MTDAELLELSARGEETAFRTLYHRHRDAVLGYAWVLTGSVPEAEDIAQECFLILVRKAGSYDPARAQLRTWLLAVTRNLWRQHCRKTRPIDADALPEPPAATTAEESLIRGEAAVAVRQAVASLPRAEREAVFLFELEGLAVKEVAAVLEISPEAVKVRLHRGRARLKQILAPGEPVEKGGGS